MSPGPKRRYVVGCRTATSGRIADWQPLGALARKLRSMSQDLSIYTLPLLNLYIQVITDVSGYSFRQDNHFGEIWPNGLAKPVAP